MSDMNNEFEGLPKSYELERYDNTKWRRFDLNNGGVVVLTNRGQELFAFNPDLRKDILTYKNEVKSEARGSSLEDGHEPKRQWFRAGGNGDVYLLGDRQVVIKEASTAHSVWSSLDRMDYLHGICKRFLPSYIKVPDQYGVLFSPDLKRQYLIMEKINNGLTVADLLNNIHGGENINPGLKKLALEEFQGLEQKVREAIEENPGKNHMPSNLLPDWDAGNVIVDFDSPTKDMPFTFCIIDQ